MSDFAKLDELLSRDVSDDYWSDELVLGARELVKRCTATDWAVFAAAWPERDEDWQLRLADALSWGEPALVMPLLAEMVERADDEVSLAAADTLATMDVPVPAELFTHHALARLEALAKTSSFNNVVVENLIARLLEPPEADEGTAPRL